MHLSSHTRIARGGSSAGHGVDSRPGVTQRSGAEGSALPHRDEGEFPLRGFTVTVQTAPCLVIDDAVGCSLQVLAGKAWVTAAGARRDVIADAGTTLPLEAGFRFNVSGFRDVATVLIAAPRHRYDIGFSLQRHNGMQVLSVTAGGGRLRASLSELSAALQGFARRFAGMMQAANG
jgi:hypothetical protein